MWRVLLLCLPGAALADSLVATRTIPAHAIVTAEDVALVAAEIPDALDRIDAALGQSVRVTIFAGRPIRSADVAPAALIERNQIVTLLYRRGALAIQTEGRSLARGAEGEMVDVLNLASRARVTGRVGADGTVIVTQP